MIELWRGLGPRERGLLAGVLAALVAAPLVADRYLLSVLTLILYFAYVGQAWNLMMGFAGQLSLGHALYVGLGAYGAALLCGVAGFHYHQYYHRYHRHGSRLHTDCGRRQPGSRPSGDDHRDIAGSPRAERRVHGRRQDV